MKIEQSFTITTPIERAWQLLTDIEFVAPCMPGATITGQDDDGGYLGTVLVKLGPLSFELAGRMEFITLDEEGRRAVLRGGGADKRGQGGADAVIVLQLVPDGDRTRCEISADVEIRGALGRFGRGIVTDVAGQVVREFAANLERAAASGEPAPAPAGASAPAEVRPSASPAPATAPSGAYEASSLITGAVLNQVLPQLATAAVSLALGLCVGVLVGKPRQIHIVHVREGK